MRTEIRKIQQTVGITAVYVTHDQAEAMSISDQIIIMNRGRIAQTGTPREVYYQPDSEFVADFIGEVNFLQGRVTRIEGTAVHVDVDGVDITADSFGQLSAGDECKIVLRPESAVLADKGRLACTVTLSTFMGAYQYYQADVKGKMVKITEYNPKNHKLYEVGDTAYLNFESHNLHIL
jgi:iron(III) transport system ATP-binding protein